MSHDPRQTPTAALHIIDEILNKQREGHEVTVGGWRPREDVLSISEESRQRYRTERE